MRTCPTGKSPYLHYGQAQKRADVMNRYHTNGGEYFMAYRCKEGCGHWHVGGRNAKEDKARRRRRRQR